MENENELRDEIAEEVWFGVSYPALDKKGEKEVRRALAKGEYGEPGTKGHSLVLSWLSSKDAERAEESLAFSRKALSNSRLATIIAIAAAIISASGIILKIVEIISIKN